jgi:hypothetical protein
MAIRARLSPSREAQTHWNWHKAKFLALPASTLWGGERRMEAENYLSSGYGHRLALQARLGGSSRLGHLARVWQPSRLKGITVSAEYGTPFLAATQAFDLRPVPRKFLSLRKAWLHYRNLLRHSWPNNPCDQRCVERASFPRFAPRRAARCRDEGMDICVP